VLTSVDVDRTLVGRPEGKRPLERPWHKWRDIIMDLKETGRSKLKSSGSGQGQGAGAFVNATMNHQVPRNAGKFLTS
jgi:hypothetical protein